MVEEGSKEENGGAKDSICQVRDDVVFYWEIGFSLRAVKKG